MRIETKVWLVAANGERVLSDDDIFYDIQSPDELTERVQWRNNSKRPLRFEVVAAEYETWSVPDLADYREAIDKVGRSLSVLREMHAGGALSKHDVAGLVGGALFVIESTHERLTDARRIPLATTAAEDE